MNNIQKEHIRTLRLKGESYGRIADALGISVNTIKSFCRRNNLTNVKIMEKVDSLAEKFYCQNCGKELPIKAKQKQRKFCSYDCRMAWWKKHPELINRKAIYHFTCTYCGNSFNSYGNKNRKYCSHPCYIKDRFHEKGVNCHDKGAV